MRITFVLSTADLAGGVRVVAIYADRLRRRGHEVLVVSTPPRQPTLRDRVKAFMKGRRLPHVPQRLPSHLDHVPIAHRVLDGRRPVTDADLPDADVVVATWWETAEWVASLSAQKGAKAYFIQHYEVHPGQPAERVRATWRLPLQKITISEWLVDLARKEFRDEMVIHVPNSVDREQFHAPPRGRQPRPTVGLMYSTAPFKGLEVSLSALRHARAQVPDLHVVVFGQHPPVPDRPLPEGSDFVLCPPQNQIRNIYARCDVWLCGSHSEGFHLPPLEAMACRCPVVSTRVGGPMDIIDEGVNGHLVDVGDAAGLAEALVRVLRLPEPSWRKMSDAALATAERYTWDHATDLFEAALEQTVRRERHSRAADAAQRPHETLSIEAPAPNVQRSKT